MTPALVYKYKHAKGRMLSWLDTGAREANTVKKTHVRTADLAIIFHVFYPEMWEQYASRFSVITVPYHIFVTTPYEKLEAVQEVTKNTPHCTVIPFQNRGRDILPFLYTAKAVADLGYKSVLKLHSKKSTHRTDGSNWADGMLTNLLPNTEIVDQTLRLLQEPRVSIIGPSKEYMALSVNFEANGMHMMYILNRLYGKTTGYRVLQQERDKHGFFAGSMFWAPLSAIQPLWDRNLITQSYFEEEAGQIDATYAHAIERVLSLIAEVENKDLYEMSPEGLRKIDYAEGVIPDWSGVQVES